MSKNWYWICYGFYKNSPVFKCTEASLYYIVAKIIVFFRNVTTSNGEWFIRKDVEHPDPTFLQFKCPTCNELLSKEDLEKTWDWSGPHCKNCGETGVKMFMTVTKKPIIISRK